VSGRLAVVGLGPGSPELLTTAAAAELASADLLIGYRRYLEWIPPQLARGVRESYELGQERLRARRAVEAAAAGFRVALVSGGDAGVYGIAALAIEEMAAGSYHLEMTVVPGVTAATAAAALVGAPLAVDFACLSLSDLLLPTEELEARIQALAAADIVLVLYNPAGRSRRAPWESAVGHLQRLRAVTTPVAAVRRAFRPGQEIHLSEVGRLHELPVDMETVVIVGSSRTRRLGNWLVTLRDRERQ
jgi:precorrin-3B C17-methyltransferase